MKKPECPNCGSQTLVLKESFGTAYYKCTTCNKTSAPSEVK